MPKLDKDTIKTIVQAKEQEAIEYCGEGGALATLRADLINYYDQELYGDEEEGKSRIVTSEVYQVVEGIIPPILRMFLQNKNIAEFQPTRKETKFEKMKRANLLKQKVQEIIASKDKKEIIKLAEMKEPPKDIYKQEAQHKTALGNYVFTQDHDPETILYSLLKDGLLALTGWVQTYFEEKEEVEIFRLTGMKESDKFTIEKEKGTKVTEEEEQEDGTFNFMCETKEKTKRIVVENIPPEEGLITPREKSFSDPGFIGQRMIKTRSELLQMGFDKELINRLVPDYDDSGTVKSARHKNEDSGIDHGSILDRSGDQFYLGRYFVKLDVDGDGVAELWQVFLCSNEVLKYERAHNHPYSVFVPVPITHKAIGTSPIAHMYKYQFLSSTLFRQILNNVSTVNIPRYFLSNAVDKEEFYSTKPGQGVSVKGSSVGDAAQMIPVDSQAGQILQVIDHVKTMIEQTTGITAYNQAMDTNSLNKAATGTATSFNGIRDMSMMRNEVMARHLGVTVEDIYNKIIMLAANHQDDEMQMMVNGEELTVSPSEWSKKARCMVDVGIGSGQRQEAIQNLSFFLDKAETYIAQGLTIADSSSLFKILDKIAVQMGQKTASDIFNDPEVEGADLQAQVEQLTGQIKQMQAALEQSNPIIEGEKIRAENKIEVEKIKSQTASQVKKADLEEQGRQRMARMSESTAALDHDKEKLKANIMFNNEKLKTEAAIKLTDIQLKTDKNVQGDLLE